MDYANENTNYKCELRLSYRIKKTKKRVHARNAYFVYIAKNSVKKRVFKQIDNMNRIEQFKELENHMTNCTEPEFKDFGNEFPFSQFLDFIITNSDPNEKFEALKVLSQATLSKKAPHDFFKQPKLNQLCDTLINDMTYLPFILNILISGSEYEDFTNYLFDSNICDFLLSCPIIYQVSMLVSSLTYTESEHLEKLLEIIFNILNDQASKKDQTISHLICCYALKSIHHIYMWDSIDQSIIDEINEKFAPLFYTIAPLLLTSDSKRVLNSVFKCMNYLNDVPLEFGNLILQIFANINLNDKKSSTKTIKLAMIPFINNVKTWINEYSDVFLEMIFTKFKNVPYDVSLTILKAVLLYYDCVDGVVDQFMPFVVELSLNFVADKNVSAQALQKLIKILTAAKNNKEIVASISASINVFEEIVFSEESDDDVIMLAEEIIDLLKKV